MSRRKEMIDFDIGSKTSKYELEQRKRREEIKKRKIREEKLQKEQEQRERGLAELAEKKREELLVLEEERAALEAEEFRATGGIKFNFSLEPYLIDGEDDKVILPESCLTVLNEQDAFGRGPLAFQLTYKKGSAAVVTHCGVREFSAEAGKIGLPKKVVESLAGEDVANSMDVDGENSLPLHRMVSIKYVQLAKCSYAKLQPIHNTFFEVGPVKLCLEENLRFHSTLTVGDVLTVWYRGKAHQLVVVEMKPDTKGSLVNTDVEIDLELSQEYLQRQQKENEYKQQQQPTTINYANSTVAVTEATPIMTKPLQAEYALSNLIEMLEEEPVDSDETISVKIKLPNGKTSMRRFPHTSKFIQMFLFSAKEAGLEDISSIQVSTRFPAKAYRYTTDECDRKTFAEVGWTGKSEAVFVAIV